MERGAGAGRFYPEGHFGGRTGKNRAWSEVPEQGVFTRKGILEGERVKTFAWRSVEGMIWKISCAGSQNFPECITIWKKLCT